MKEQETYEAISHEFVCDVCGTSHKFRNKIDTLLFICWKCNNPLTVKFEQSKG